MITTLHLKNFQSHKDTLLEFGAGVNAVVGCTDSGKSAIIRAIYLLAENKPTGNAFIRNGNTDVFVTATLDDGTEIQRAKGSKNQYLLNGDVFNAVGMSVPAEITTALAIDTNISFQRQSSPYFLLHSTPSERGKLLDEFSGMSVVGESAAIARRRALQYTKRVNSLTEQLAPKESQLGALDTLYAQQARVVHINKLETELSTCRDGLEKLSRLQPKLQAIDKKLTVDTKALADIIARLQEIIAQANDLVTKQRQLVSLQTQLSKAIPAPIAIPKYINTDEEQASIRVLSKIRATLSTQIPSRILVPSYIDTIPLRVKGRALVAIQKQLAKTIPSLIPVPNTTSNLKLLSDRKSVLVSRADVLRVVDEKIVVAQTRLNLIKDGLAEFKVCPLCNSPMEETW